MAEPTFGDPRVPSRVWAKLTVHPETGCWLWSGKPTREGYGRVQVDGRMYRVHRYTYAVLVRPLAEAEVLDHVCHSSDRSCNDGHECVHRRCARPDHCEPVTAEENGRRVHTAAALRATCPAGHPYDAANTRWYRGMRYCIACATKTSAERSRRSRLAKPELAHARDRRYRDAHREQRREAARDWRVRNLDRDRERQRAYRQRNAERQRERCRAWREAQKARVDWSGRGRMGQDAAATGGTSTARRGGRA